VSQTFDTRRPAERAEGITAAIEAVRLGRLVVMPTDTVYGIGADAFDNEAVAELVAAKGRGRDMPVPVLIGSWQTLDGLVRSVPQRTRDLVEAFWPGGLTLVVEHAPSLAWDLGDAYGTVAVRMPLHPVALDILTETGPMAVSSANLTGHPPAATAAEAQAQLGYRVDIYLEAGEGGAQVPSTIIDVTAEVPRVLRLGAIELDELRKVVPDLEAPE
jgi:tRNA threonylcarbamoyl adenosine modification protein (Sua5/YciO/YrdC/YwlC family)